MSKKLGFGFMRLPLLDKDKQKSIDYNTLNKMVDTFLERGFTYFDTALVYHQGESENALRKALVERHPRESFMLATKLPPRVLRTAEDQERIFNEQLKRCGVEFFDYYLVHNIGVSSYREALQFGTFDFVQEKKRQGLIRNVGMSFHDTPELLDTVLDAHPGLDFVQLQINYIDWENPGIQSRRCHEVARKHNLPIVVMEPCKGGNLAEVPKAAAQLMQACTPNASIPSWAMRFAAGQEGVIMVLSGMNTMEQLLDNMASLDHPKPLSAEEYQVLEQVVAIINQNAAIPCTTCRYCTNVCPKKIPIPDYFALYNSAKRAITDNLSSQFMYYLNLAATRANETDCIFCRRCDKICPQHLHIPELLKEVAATFKNMEPPSVKD